MEMCQLRVRLPADVKRWIEEQATRNASSQNSEIVRAIRAQMAGISSPGCLPPL